MEWKKMNKIFTISIWLYPNVYGLWQLQKLTRNNKKKCSFNRKFQFVHEQFTESSMGNNEIAINYHQIQKDQYQNKTVLDCNRH